MIKFDLAVVGNRVCFQILDMFENQRYTGDLLVSSNIRYMSTGINIGSYEYPSLSSFKCSNTIWLRGNKGSLDNDFCTVEFESATEAREAASKILKSLQEWAHSGGFYPAPAMPPAPPVAFCSTYNL